MAQALAGPEVPRNLLPQILNAARDGCNGVGSPSTIIVPPAQFLEGSPSQAAALLAAGLESINVLSSEKSIPFTDRQIPPGFGIIGYGGYVARVDNPTDARLMQAYGALRSYLRSRATDVRETPVEGLGPLAIALHGSVTHANGQRLDYQASAAITRGILFGAEARGEVGSRRDLILMITARISRAIDVENW